MIKNQNILFASLKILSLILIGGCVSNTNREISSTDPSCSQNCFAFPPYTLGLEKYEGVWKSENAGHIAIKIFHESSTTSSGEVGYDVETRFEKIQDWSRFKAQLSDEAQVLINSLDMTALRQKLKENKLKESDIPRIPPELGIEIGFKFNGDKSSAFFVPPFRNATIAFKQILKMELKHEDNKLHAHFLHENSLIDVSRGEEFKAVYNKLDEEYFDWRLKTFEDCDYNLFSFMHLGIASKHLNIVEECSE